MTSASRRRNRGDGSAKLAVLIALLVFAAAFHCVSHSRPVRNLLNIRVVEIETGSGVEISPVLATSKFSEGETFSQMIDRLHPYAAINGTYYDKNMRPLGDIVDNGKLINRGSYRNALAVTRSGKVVFLHRKRGRLNWSGYKAGIAAGPRLVHNGKIALGPIADGFTARSMSIKAWRSGVGKTKTGKLLLVVAKESLTLSEFARIMLDLGSVEAMNLDGGGACGLYHDGRTLVTPALPMTNILAVYKKDTRR